MIGPRILVQVGFEEIAIDLREARFLRRRKRRRV